MDLPLAFSVHSDYFLQVHGDWANVNGMFQIKIFQNIDEGGRSSLSIMPLFLEAK